MTAAHTPAAPSAERLQAFVSQGLAPVEVQLAAMAEAMVSGNPDGLQAVATALRNAAADFSRCLDVPGAAQAVAACSPLQARVRQVGVALAQHRTQMARRMTIVDRAVASLLPDVAAKKAVTYGAAGGAMRSRFG